VGQDGVVFGRFEESLPRVVLAQPLDLRHAREVAAPLGEAERLPE